MRVFFLMNTVENKNKFFSIKLLVNSFIFWIYNELKSILFIYRENFYMQMLRIFKSFFFRKIFAFFITLRFSSSENSCHLYAVCYISPDIAALHYFLDRNSPTARRAPSDFCFCKINLSSLFFQLIDVLP